MDQSKAEMEQPKILSDLPTGKDFLGFERYADAFARIITSSNLETPITIGIHGKWGTGKTFLLKMIETKVRERGIKTVWFSAWRYNQEKELWVALLQSVLNQMSEQSSCFQNLKVNIEVWLHRINRKAIFREILKTFALFCISFVLAALLLMLPAIKGKMDPLVTALQASGMIAALKLSFPLVVGLWRRTFGFNLEELVNKVDFEEHIAFLDKISDEFQEIVRDFVGEHGIVLIFVDDLDRCLPEKAVEILEAIKAFIDIKNCVFILGLDAEVIQQDLERHLALDQKDAVNYIEKIIQIPFHLPPLKRSDVAEFLKEILEDKELLAGIESVGRGLPTNIRKAKRFVNTFCLLDNIARERGMYETEQISRPLLVKWALIIVRFPEFVQDSTNYNALPRVLQQLFDEKQKYDADPQYSQLPWEEKVAQFHNRKQKELENPIVKKHFQNEELEDLFLHVGPQFPEEFHMSPYLFLSKMVLPSTPTGLQVQVVGDFD
jgi:hypothetical protein